jgi:hypothetical protein
MAYEFDTTVLGGLPVTVEFTTTGYDNRDCGGGVDDVDDWSIVAVAGKFCKKAPAWIYARMSKGDNERVTEECYEYLGG